MPTLYVENVPKSVYEALRKRAKAHRRSLASEVIALLEASVPTESALRRRKELLSWVEQVQASQAISTGVFPTTEQMIREDRER